VKKPALTVLVLLVLCYPGVSWLIGRSAQARITEATDRAQGQAAYLTVVERKYQRGWFTSEQDVTYRLSLGALPMVPGGAGGAPQFKIHSVIHHGPICGLTCVGLTRTEVHLVFSDAVKAQLAKVFGTQEPLSITSTTGLFGGATTVITSPRVPNAKLEQGGSFSSDGLRVVIDEGRNADHWSMSGQLPAMSVTDGRGQQAELTGLVLKGDEKRTLRQLYDGAVEVSVAKVSFGNSKLAKQGSVENLGLVSSSKSAGGYTDIGYDLSMGALHTPTFNLDGAHYAATVRHLDSNALATMLEALQKVSSDATLTPAERTDRSTSAMREYLPALLAGDPQLTIDRISIDGPSGKLLVTGSVRAPGITADDFAQTAPAGALMHKFEADLDLSVDDGLFQILPGGADKAEADLARYAAQGLVTRADGHTATKIALRDGAFTFNGKPYAAPTGPGAVR